MRHIRKVAAAFAAIAMTGWTGVAGAQDGPGAGRATVTIDPARTIGTLPDDFMGFSFEKPVLSNDTLNPAQGNVARLLTNLSRRGHLRFGGTLMDTVTWWRTDDDRPRPLYARYVVDRPHMDALAELVRQTGWQVEMGTNLENFDRASTVDEASYTARVLGPNLVGFACGNEIDLFRDQRDWARQRPLWERCADAVAPYAKLRGGEEADGLRPAMLATVGRRLSEATSHFYAQYENCDGPKGRQRFLTADMLTRETVRRTTERLGREVARARAVGLPYRVSESNSAACLRQDDAGNVYAAALWSVDYQLLAATLGVTGVNMHVPWESWRPCSDRMTYAAMCAETAADRESNRLRANPLYYGMLTVASVRPGSLLATTVSAASNLTAYAVRGVDGGTQVVLVQKDAPGGAPVTVEIGGLRPRGIATTRRLEAPSLLSGRDAIRFAGAQVTESGTFTPREIGRVRPTARGYTLTVPTGTATVLTIPSDVTR